MSDGDETFLGRWLAGYEHDSPTYVTPWGRQRSLSMTEMRRLRDSGGPILLRELCMIYRDSLEHQGRDPRQAMDGAIALVRRGTRERKRARRRELRRARRRRR